MRRILVIRRKALGDALVTLPAVLRLCESFPAAAVDLVVDRPFADLLAGLAGGVRVLAWPPDGGGTVRNTTVPGSPLPETDVPPSIKTVLFVEKLP